MRRLMTLLPVVVLVGCAVETAGTKGLPANRVAVLTANESVGGKNYNNCRISQITIDGCSYTLGEKPTQFRLLPGEHIISVSPLSPRKQPARCFTALPGCRYRVAAWESSAGVFFDVRDGEGHDVSSRQASQPVAAAQ